MAFVLKKSKPVRVKLGDGNDALVLLIKKVKVEKLLEIYQQHEGFLEEVEEQKLRGVERVKLPVNLMRDLKETLIEATADWEEVVDEDNKPVPFDREVLSDLIEHDMSLYVKVLSAINALAGNPELEASEKNSSSSSPSANVH